MATLTPNAIFIDTQIRRIYGTNRHLCDTSTPARLDLFGLGASSGMREKLEAKFTGFDDAIIGKWPEANPKEIYGPIADQLEFVVLTPDRLGGMCRDWGIMGVFEHDRRECFTSTVCSEISMKL